VPQAAAPVEPATVGEGENVMAAHPAGNVVDHEDGRVRGLQDGRVRALPTVAQEETQYDSPGSLRTQQSTGVQPAPLPAATTQAPAAADTPAQPATQSPMVAFTRPIAKLTARLSDLLSSPDKMREGEQGGSSASPCEPRCLMRRGAFVMLGPKHLSDPIDRESWCVRGCVRVCECIRGSLKTTP
jgi:hypothetical protein